MTLGTDSPRIWETVENQWLAARFMIIERRYISPGIGRSWVELQKISGNRSRLTFGLVFSNSLGTLLIVTSSQPSRVFDFNRRTVGLSVVKPSACTMWCSVKM